MTLCEEAKRVAYDFYHDPGYALVAFGRNAWSASTARSAPTRGRPG